MLLFGGCLVLLQHTAEDMFYSCEVASCLLNRMLLFIDPRWQLQFFENSQCFKCFTFLDMHNKDRLWGFEQYEENLHILKNLNFVPAKMLQRNQIIKSDQVIWRKLILHILGHTSNDKSTSNYKEKEIVSILLISM